MMKHIILGILLLMTISIQAQPADDIINQSLKASIADISQIEILEKNTDKQSGNAIVKVTVFRNNKLAQRNEIIYGNAIFKEDKDGNFDLVKFVHQTNQFEGISQITIEDIKAVIVKNHHKFFADDLNNIVNLIQHPQCTDDVFIYWLSPEEVEVYVKYRAQIISNKTETNLVDKVVAVTLLKKDKSKEWNDFNTKPLLQHPENKVHETQQFTEEQIDGFRNRTLNKVHYWLKY